ncbi:hypothetical protein DFQ28_009176 [Apophysomyces sp. BC1034]|nr:hypothetical protein DFQ30_010092 [Apophysomyces sp. BC1015]KAG0176976.1 hypothetical protein DFQ29_005378 [Apophysomyces sp. BC1021]KAG0192451.1 hypothetical protein DFQ28_009176 [Apophysomyces sp. BC1034]
MTEPTKLRNPTEYHLMAKKANVEDQMDYVDGYSHQFLSPVSSSPLHDFDDLDFRKSRKVQSLRGSDMMAEESPSDYSLASGGEDIFGSPMSSSFVGPVDIHHQHNPHHHRGSTGSIRHSGTGSALQSYMLLPGEASFPMSAPANIGYDFLNGTSFPSGHMHPGLALQQQQQQQALSVQPTSNPRSFEEDYAMQMNLQAMMEKRRRRRESHNAVERRRRENINERIQELGTLLPEAMLDDITSGGNGGPSNKPNKGAILRKSVEHLRMLQQEIEAYQQRVKDLEVLLEKYKQEQRYHA